MRERDVSKECLSVPIWKMTEDRSIGKHSEVQMRITPKLAFCKCNSVGSPDVPQTFATVFLYGVAGHADTFPSFPVSGPFLPDVPGFQVPPDTVPVSFHLNCGLPLGRFASIFILATADVFCIISSFDEPESFQHSP